jgi:hypothetical protein
MNCQYWLYYFVVAFSMTSLFVYKQTKDEDGSRSKKEEMDYDGECAPDDNGDVETFDHDYDYADPKYGGYDNDGGEADDIFYFL